MPLHYCRLNIYGSLTRNRQSHLMLQISCDFQDPQLSYKNWINLPIILGYITNWFLRSELERMYELFDESLSKAVMKSKSPHRTFKDLQDIIPQSISFMFFRRIIIIIIINDFQAGQERVIKHRKTFPLILLFKEEFFYNACQNKIIRYMVVCNLGGM